MAVTVTELSVEDREQWAALYRGYAEFYQVPMNEDILDTVWSWIFDPDRAFYCFLVKTSDQAAGLNRPRYILSGILPAQDEIDALRGQLYSAGAFFFLILVKPYWSPPRCPGSK